MYFGPGPTQYKSIYYSSGGGVTSYFTPTFAGTGASLEVHALGDGGNELGSKTFSLSSTVQGAAFLGETAGATTVGGSGGFTAWIDSLIALGFGEPCGFIGYARSAAVTIGRGGTGPPYGGRQIFPANGVVSSSQPETLAVGEALAWCLVADSHGWDIRGASGDESGNLGGGQSDSVVVSNTALRIFGTTGAWTSTAATQNSAFNRWYKCSNCNALGGADKYVSNVAASSGDNTTGAPTSSKFATRVSPGPPVWHYVPSGKDALVIAGGVDTGQFWVEEFIAL